MNRKTLIYGTLAVVIIAIIAAIGLANRNAVPNAASQAPMQSKLKVGDTAPEFKVDTNAGPFDLASVQTPVLLEVFATWCPHCQHETVILNDLATKYQGKIAMVAVSGSPYGMDGSSPESLADVNTFGQTFRVRYPLAFDPQLTVGQQYLLGGYPTIVLIKPDKKIAFLKDGEIPEADLVKAINGVL
ncbi:MAG TPA: TlpA disulfide reductase family protein [Candidatus Sulfotelmatobacter sp.]|nr:TlpA disulfide reductase family protein [Candidatus Sulfotelmatobacter sp.]